MIRRAIHADAAEIIRSHIRSIREICAKDYSAEQVEAWAGRDFKIERWCAAIDRDFVWVVDQGGVVSGFGHLSIKADESAYLEGLYFVPEAKGQGYGKKLFQEMLLVARDHNVKRIDLHSTLTSKTFYEALGFRESEGEFGVKMQGVLVPCYPMSMEI